MKISELQTELEKAKMDFGDVEVKWCEPADDGSNKTDDVAITWTLGEELPKEIRLISTEHMGALWESQDTNEIED